MRVLAAMLVVLGLMLGTAHAALLPLIVESDNSKGLTAGDPVMFEGKEVGTVGSVGFGERDTVEIHLTIDSSQRDRIRQGGAFVINEAVNGKRPNLEYFLIDAKSPAAKPNARMTAAHSVAEVWLRRGRISADELSRAMSQGVDQMRRNLEELRNSPEWGKFKDQVARLSAQLTITGSELTKLLNEQLPKLQRDLDDLYSEYQKDLEKAERERTPKR